MMWLSRNTKVLDSSPPLKNGTFMNVLCDQVTWFLGLLTISLASTTSMNDVPIIGGKRIMELQHRHLFLPEADCKLRKSLLFFFQKGHFLMKRPIPGRFNFLKEALASNSKF